MNYLRKFIILIYLVSLPAVLLHAAEETAPWDEQALNDPMSELQGEVGQNMVQLQQINAKRAVLQTEKFEQCSGIEKDPDCPALDQEIENLTQQRTELQEQGKAVAEELRQQLQNDLEETPETQKLLQAQEEPSKPLQ